MRPHNVLLVVDAMTGQDAVNVAEQFAETAQFDGVVMTKLDGDARGGAALSIKAVTGKPILYASTGEKLAEFEPFHPDRMASRILGMGDVLSFIEKAEKTVDADRAAGARAQDPQAGVRLRRLPRPDEADPAHGPDREPDGDAAGLRPAEAAEERQGRRARARPDRGDRDLDDAEERRNPQIIDGSRRKRIAAGSGTTGPGGEPARSSSSPRCRR